jgi:hypothetical protein
MSVRNKEYHDASGQSQNEAMACIWAADKIDNSHLWSRVTNFRQRWQAAIEGSPRDPQSIASPSDKIAGGRNSGVLGSCCFLFAAQYLYPRRRTVVGLRS